jgi:hypothetical protein
VNLVKVIPHKFKDRKSARIVEAILNEPENQEIIKREVEKRLINSLIYGG